MEQFFQQLTNGLAVGGIYALIALGYTMVYGVLKLINFAHGDLFSSGAYLGLTMVASFGLIAHCGHVLGFAALVAMVMASVAFLGLVLERTAYKPLRKSARLSAVVSALGASILLQNALMLIYGARYLVFPQNIIPSMPVNLFGIYVPLVRIIILAISFLMMIGLYLFIQKTRIGTAIRAAAIDQGAAQLMGINVDRVISFTFATGAAFAGLGGVLYAIAYASIWTQLGILPGLKAFVAAVLGGIGSLPGAFVGALIMGQAESLTMAYISTPMRDAVAFTILIIVLLVKPTGIFGEPAGEKA